VAQHNNRQAAKNAKIFAFFVCRRFSDKRKRPCLRQSDIGTAFARRAGAFSFLLPQQKGKKQNILRALCVLNDHATAWEWAVRKTGQRSIFNNECNYLMTQRLQTTFDMKGVLYA